MPKGPGPGPTFDIIAGKEQEKAYDEQAKQFGEQSNFAYLYGLEQERQNDYMVTKFKAQQESQFAAGGVDISGSALAVMTETQTLGDQMSKMIRKKADLESNLLEEQGLQALRSGSFAAFSGQARADIATWNYQVAKAQAQNGAIGAGIAGVGGVASALGGAMGFGHTATTGTP